MTDERERPMEATVLAHVQTERALQRERWSHDAEHSDDEWNDLIRSRLDLPGASRYVRLIQTAALAVAAAEQESPT